MTRPNMDDTSFFFDVFMPLSLRVFRFNYFVTSNIAKSFSSLFRVVEEFYDEIKTMNDTDERLQYMLKQCWQNLDKKSSTVKAIETGKLQRALSSFSVEERGYIAAFDCLGIDTADTGSIFTEESAGNIKDKLEKAQDKIKTAMQVADYVDAKPYLQDFFNASDMKDGQKKQILNLILPSYDEEVEKSKVSSDAESGLRKERLLKYCLLAGLVVLFVVTVSYLSVEQHVERKVIESLGYESLAIEEEGDRLDFPSTNYEEIKTYFENDRSLSFKQSLLQLPDQWLPEGAGIVDYGFVKIAVTKYKRGDDLVFLYAFEGNIDNLSAEKINKGENFTYMSYSSEDLNMIVWQIKHLVSVLVSRLGSEDLLKMAMEYIKQ